MRRPEITDLGDGRASVRFWHHDRDATAVALVASGWWHPEPVDARDLVLADDGWWTILVEVPDDWQVSYRFAVHRGPGSPPWWERGLKDPGCEVVPDATHDLRQTAGRMGVSSVLRLPRAQRTWLAGAETHEPRPGRPADSPWDCWTWRSGGEGPLPLLVVTDGRAHVERLRTHRVLRAAVDEGALPDLAIVFVDSGPDRQRDLGVPDGQAQWFGEELVPALRREGVDGAPVTDDPSRTVVVGSSFGALTALFAVARRPEVIGSAIAQSPSLWRHGDGALVQPLVDADRVRPLRLRLQAGTEEGLVPGARDLAATLVAEGVDATFAPRTGGHDWAWWLPGIVDEAALLLR